jgi:hypothetical protein
VSLPDTVALESGMPLAYLHTGPTGHVMKKPDRQAAMDKVRAEFLREHMVVNEADGTVRIKPGLVAVIQMGRGEQVRQHHIPHILERQIVSLHAYIACGTP